MYRGWEEMERIQLRYGLSEEAECLSLVLREAKSRLKVFENRPEYIPGVS